MVLAYKLMVPFRGTGELLEATGEGTGTKLTAIHVLGLVPQALLAVTQILPLTNPAFTIIECEPCPAVIAEPEGTVQM